MDQDDITFRAERSPTKTAQNITRVEELAYELRVNEVMTADLKAFRLKLPMADALELIPLGENLRRAGNFRWKSWWVSSAWKI